jgi:hypothetical protein
MSISDRFRDRIAWLRRMPRHYRLLFGSQAMFTVYAITYYRRLSERARLQEEIESIET